MNNCSLRTRPSLYLLALSLTFFALPSVRGETVIWDLNPVDGNWENVHNWTPAMLPLDLATFGVSNLTDITLPQGADLTDMTFNAGASSFTFTLEHPIGFDTFAFTNRGVRNISGVTQSFYVNALRFNNRSSAGNNAVYTVLMAQGSLPNAIAFWDNSDAGRATIVNNPSGLFEPNLVMFTGAASAGSSTIIDNGPEAITTFDTVSTAGQSNIICNGTDVIFRNASTAGASTITSNLAAGITFQDASSADAATLIVGLGGAIEFENHSQGGTARVRLIGGALIIRTTRGVPFVIGSVEGGPASEGSIPSVSIAAPLQVGSNDLDTVYAGQFISRTSEGTLSKIGNGTLTLKDDSPYLRGSVTITGGALIVANTTGSATGTGNVIMNAGTLGGGGFIGGGATIGTGSGPGASLAPAAGGDVKIFHTTGALTFDADGTYSCLFQSRGRMTRADQITAAGVRIQAGAQFVLDEQGTSIANSPGASFIVISNTSANPFSGTFANLADGAIISVDDTRLQASYEGGDGNDLTLTVLP